MHVVNDVPVQMAPQMTLDTELQRLLSKTLTTHQQAAQKVVQREVQAGAKATASHASHARGSARLATAPLGRRAPTRQERKNFLSSNPSKIYETESADAAPPPATRGGRSDDPEEDSVDFRNMARAVEEFGASMLGGLAKKDQAARKRSQLALKPVKEQKRPYKQLVELRKKQRTQDSAAADLAREAGNKARKSTVGGGERKRDAEARKKKRTEGGIDGNATRNGVLHVPRSVIKDVQFKSRERPSGKGKGKGSKGGGKGKGGRGGGKGGGRAGGKGGGDGGKGRGGAKGGGRGGR